MDPSFARHVLYQGRVAHTDRRTSRDLHWERQRPRACIRARRAERVGTKMLVFSAGRRARTPVTVEAEALNQGRYELLPASEVGGIEGVVTYARDATPRCTKNHSPQL